MPVLVEAHPRGQTFDARSRRRAPPLAAAHAAARTISAVSAGLAAARLRRHHPSRETGGFPTHAAISRRSRRYIAVQDEEARPAHAPESVAADGMRGVRASALKSTKAAWPRR
jgi:hypothetical protein